MTGFLRLIHLSSITQWYGVLPRMKDFVDREKGKARESGLFMARG
jgi:hypothetical protein